MSWIERLAPFRKGGSAVAEAIREEKANSHTNNGPSLMCLVNDASGRASFKTHVFPDSQSATDFVLYWFPHQNDSGLTAFWAMTHEPALDGSSQITVEPVVMVRDLGRDGVVYLFSFSDMESAQAFLRDEVGHGTDLASMMLYWAVPVRMAADSSGQMRLIPSAPPGFAHDVQAEADAAAADMWASLPTSLATESPHQEPVEDSRAIFAEAPNAYTGVATPESAGDETFELTAWMERARRKPSADSDAHTPETVVPPISAEAPPARAKTRRTLPPVVEQRSPTQPSAPEVPEITPAAIVEEAPATNHASLEFAPTVDDAPAVFEESEPEETAEITDAPAPSADAEVPLDNSKNGTSEDLILLAAEPVVEEAPTPVDAQPEAPVEADITDSEVQFDLGTIRVNANGNGLFTDADTHDNGHITLEPAEILVHQNGSSAQKPAEADSDAALEPATEARPKVVRANDDVDHGVDIRIEIHLNSSRAMKVKRWEDKEDPFEGFNSPPGRF